MSWKTLEGKPIENIFSAIRSDVESFNGTFFAYIGTDSQTIPGKSRTDFVQCVALHKYNENGIGKGGRVYYIKFPEKMYVSMHKRLFREAELAIKLGKKMEPLFDELGIEFEVHCDVNSYAGKDNENKSNSVHDSVKGWVESMGWVCKTKPNAVIGSIVADRMTKNKKRNRPFRKKVN